MRNDMNHFEYNPTSLKITRSRFKMPHSHKTTFNSGELIPFKVYEMLPGDTFNLNMSSVCRMSTPIYPVMDNAYLDVYWFAVPLRLLWDHTKEFFGENTEGPWAADTEYQIPHVRTFHNRNFVQSIYDQLGLQVNESAVGANGATYSFSALPIRAYALIWNEWFRDQNISAPLYIDKGDADTMVDLTHLNDGLTWFNYGFDKLTTDWMKGIPLPVGRFHDMFTSMLPEPQKGPAVTLPFADQAEVIAGDEHLYVGEAASPLWFKRLDTNGNISGVIAPSGTLGVDQGGTVANNTPVDGSTSTISDVAPTNLWADLSTASAISVNTLRQAFAMQRLFEKDARGGTRYRELIRTHFGVTSPDSRMQVPEFIGGRRVPITMQQVPQTSATDAISPQGNTAAFSLTQDKAHQFRYSATEHCLVMGVCCVRPDVSYSRGIRKMWSRRRKFDYYWPVFANLGEQPIYRKELWAQGDSRDDVVIGYQEAWAEYRYEPNTVAGYMRPDVTGSIGKYWTYTNSDAEIGRTITLDPKLIYQPPTNIDRTLAVSSSVAPQFFCDFYFDLEAVRPMPLYSIPGLVDHY